MATNSNFHLDVVFNAVSCINNIQNRINRA